jgi:transposase
LPGSCSPVLTFTLKRFSADSALAAACGLSQKDFDEDLLYEAMDALSGRWSGIEKNLYNISYPDGLTLVLYDLTSSYFEGAKNKKLSAYGHSRDHRCDRQQVILALATSAEGIPVHIEVLKGNRSDSKTLLPLLETMKRRFGITKAVFCFDGGMSSFLNLQQMRDDEIDYVTRLSKPSLAALVETLPVNKQPELWDRTELVEFEIEGIRYVVAGSQYRQQRDFERREVRIEKGRKALIKFNQVKRKKIDLCKLSSQVGRMLERNKCLKYFDFSIQDNGQAIWTEKQELINAEERFDGWYLLTTSLSAKEADKTNILSHYKNLMAVENAFRETKNYLEVRPIYHQKDNRVRNHIRICFLAYWISAKLSTQWKELEENSEVTLILKELQQIRIGKIKIGENKLKLSMTEIPNRLYSILENLNLLNLFKKIPKWVS